MTPGKIGAVVKRHQAGKHSNTCKVWDVDYMGEVCKYSWEPYGKIAHQIAFRPSPSVKD